MLVLCSLRCDDYCWGTSQTPDSIPKALRCPPHPCDVLRELSLKPLESSVCTQVKGQGSPEIPETYFSVSFLNRVVKKATPSTLGHSVLKSTGF